VQEAFKQIFRRALAYPLMVQSDQGTEFESRAMQPFFNERGIKQYSVKSQFKASLVERFQRTLKEKMWRYFTHKHTRRWIDVLQSLLSAYNNAPHRSIGMSPNQMTPNNEMYEWLRAEEGPTPILKTKRSVKVGDTVSLSRVKNVFEKGYLPNWTTEIFTVSKVLNTHPPQYKVRDYNNEEIRGSFYIQELQVVDLPADYDIEEIVGQKRVNGRLYYHIKWLGYPTSMNTWEPAENLRQL